MTLFTLEGLVLARKHGTDPLVAVRAAYGRWLHTQGGPAVTRPLLGVGRGEPR
jgi:hypothetical protein